MKKTAFVVANIAVAIVGGRWLAQFVATLLYEMPQWLDSAIRAGIRITGSSQLDNTDGIETLAAIVFFVACSALVGLVLVGINLTVRHCLALRRRASVGPGADLRTGCDGASRRVWAQKRLSKVAGDEASPATPCPFSARGARQGFAAPGSRPPLTRDTMAGGLRADLAMRCRA